MSYLRTQSDERFLKAELYKKFGKKLAYMCNRYNIIDQEKTIVCGLEAVMYGFPSGWRKRIK